MAGDDEAEPTTRDARFIKTAVEILRETGRTDFTVQEVVARSKTSLRAFYQHFSSKDELLIALLERTMAQSTQVWRAETTGLDSTAAIKLIIDRISAEPESSTQDSLNRAMNLYNQHLAETRPRDYARVLSPLHDLLRDVVAARHHRRSLPAQPRCRARSGDRHADHLGRPPTALAGSRIDRCANRCGPPVRLLHPRAGQRRRGASRRRRHSLSCSTRSGCGPARTTASSR